MNLRLATPAEFESVYEILHQNALWLYQKNIIQRPLDWLQSKRQEIQESIIFGTYYVIDIEDQIAAVVELKSASEDLWKNDNLRAIYIHKLAIRREYANKNLGRKIINLIELRAIQQEIKYLRLDCVAHNDKLRQYYESFGFVFKIEVDFSEVSLALYEYKINSSFFSDVANFNKLSFDT